MIIANFCYNLTSQKTTTKKFGGLTSILC